jgi:hypothetical protein
MSREQLRMRTHSTGRRFLAGKEAALGHEESRERRPPRPGPLLLSDLLDTVSREDLLGWIRVE